MSSESNRGARKFITNFLKSDQLNKPLVVPHGQKIASQTQNI